MDINNWKKELDAMASPQEHHETLKQIWVSFLASPDADDHTFRTDALTLYLHLEDLFS